MKIIIVTQNAPIYLNLFLDDFLKMLKKSNHSLEGIVVLSPIFRNSLINEIIDRYNYYGLIDFIRLMIKILTNKFLSTGFNIFYTKPYSIKNVIKKYRINDLSDKSINSKKFVDEIINNKIDLVVSIASSKIFFKPLLNAPNLGCINYHTSLLPKYRGRQPMFWALLNGEKEIGISIHEMDEEIDNGPIIIQEKINVDSNETLDSLYMKTIRVGPKLLLRAVDIISKKLNDRIVNDRDKATYYGFPTKEDSRLFRMKGKNFF